jgi:hypothetical protein
MTDNQGHGDAYIEKKTSRPNERIFVKLVHY